MGRRIELELTSNRDDGSWTWRAAGAKKPKGVLDATLLYDGAQVGDVVKADAEYHVDGIEILAVTPPASQKERGNILEMKPRALRDDELVTTQRVKRNDRGGRDRQGRDGRSRERNRAGGNRSDSRGSSRRPQKDEQPLRPKPKRLRPGRVHRNQFLNENGDEFRPILEQLLREGMPGVRKAIEKQNAEAKEAGKPEIDATPILAIAESNVSKARIAEWRDKADAAIADADEIDLRDLRSVVVSGTDLAREDQDRQLAEQLKEALDTKVEADHQAWLSDLDAAIKSDRVVRALRLSSRPVKAGAPLPAELATTLSTQASTALASDVTQDRWATVLDALAFSPVRSAVTPAGIPSEPNEELLADVRRLSDRVPAIAGLFGIDPAEVPKSAKRRRTRHRKSGDKGKPGTRSKTKGKAETKQSQGSDSSSEAGASSTKPSTDAPPDSQSGTENKPQLSSAAVKPDDNQAGTTSEADSSATEKTGSTTSSAELPEMLEAPQADSMGPAGPDGEAETEAESAVDQLQGEPLMPPQAGSVT